MLYMLKCLFKGSLLMEENFMLRFQNLQTKATTPVIKQHFFLIILNNKRT